MIYVIIIIKKKGKGKGGIINEKSEASGGGALTHRRNSLYLQISFE